MISEDRVEAAVDKAELRRRFLSKVFFGGDDDCWPWTGYQTKGGYGVFRVGHTTQLAHRVAWMLANGVLPEPRKAVIAHHCDNPSCVNERHLYYATQSENMIDAAIKRRLWKQKRKTGAFGPSLSNKMMTHCPKGHPLFGDNLRIVGSRQQRRCYACTVERDRRYRND